MGIRKKHIVYVITRAEEGGAQTHVFLLIKSLYREFRITLITGENGYLEEQGRKLGIEVNILPALKRSWTLLGDIKAFYQLTRLFKSLNPDLIHFHSTKAGIIGRLAARNKYKTVFTAHGWVFADGAPPLRRKLGKFLERMVANSTNIIIVVSDADYQLARKYKITDEKKIQRIHNGIELTQAISHAGKANNNPPKMVTVARLVEQKDHATLLQAMCEVKVPFELLIVGDGPLEQDIRKLINELNLDSCVKLLGNSREVMAILSTADIFVLSTNWEGFPVSTLEAMSLKLPVVATDVGGIKEQVIHDETGFLVEPKNPKALASYLSQLLSNENLRTKLGNNAYQLARKKFNLEQMLTKTKSIYLKLTAR